MLLAPLLAGCTDAGEPDRASQGVRINIVADGPYEVGLPLLLHEGGPSLQEWTDLMHVSRGEATPTTRDGFLWITGNGTANLEAHHARVKDSCCATGYLEAAWSRTQTSDDEVAVLVTLGPVDSLSLHYAAENRTCWREANYVNRFGRLEEGPGLLDGLDAQGCFE